MEPDGNRIGFEFMWRGIGVPNTFVLRILAQSGNTISVYDETHSSAVDAKNATISGYVVTYGGDHYPVSPCTNMSISSSVTLDGAGTSFSGTGTVTCLSAVPVCTVPITITGNKI
jgi:hypothetical protein